MVMAFSETLTPDNFIQTRSGIWLINFYSPTCPFSRQFRPYWDLATDQYVRTRPSKHIKFALLDCKQYWDALCKHIDGYPTQLLYIDGQVIDEYPREDDSIQPLIDFLDRKLANVSQKQSNQTAY
ncbi:hypothetical protein DSO57_1034714 [Entomophthora muscae]|uniref:Uncharacterized protein n=1 Tax=Entomophthora muscae TaxID=34485 RepID=A0ACC2REH6_9FUNG|nr:hypothetical protein DSO57_1034714 [Entomophthora muscae]